MERGNGNSSYLLYRIPGAFRESIFFAYGVIQVSLKLHLNKKIKNGLKECNSELESIERKKRRNFENTEGGRKIRNSG